MSHTAISLIEQTLSGFLLKHQNIVQYLENVQQKTENNPYLLFRSIENPFNQKNTSDHKENSKDTSQISQIESMQIALNTRSEPVILYAQYMCAAKQQIYEHYSIEELEFMNTHKNDYESVNEFVTSILQQWDNHCLEQIMNLMDKAPHALGFCTLNTAVSLPVICNWLQQENKPLEDNEPYSCLNYLNFYQDAWMRYIHIYTSNYLQGNNQITGDRFAATIHRTQSLFQQISDYKAQNTQIDSITNPVESIIPANKTGTRVCF